MLATGGCSCSGTMQDGVNALPVQRTGCLDIEEPSDAYQQEDVPLRDLDHGATPHLCTAALAHGYDLRTFRGPTQPAFEI